MYALCEQHGERERTLNLRAGMGYAATYNARRTSQEQKFFYWTDFFYDPNPDEIVEESMTDEQIYQLLSAAFPENLGA